MWHKSINIDRRNNFFCLETFLLFCALQFPEILSWTSSVEEVNVKKISALLSPFVPSLWNSLHIITITTKIVTSDDSSLSSSSSSSPFDVTHVIRDCILMQCRPDNRYLLHTQSTNTHHHHHHYHHHHKHFEENQITIDNLFHASFKSTSSKGENQLWYKIKGRKTQKWWRWG